MAVRMRACTSGSSVIVVLMIHHSISSDAVMMIPIGPAAANPAGTGGHGAWLIQAGFSPLLQRLFGPRPASYGFSAAFFPAALRLRVSAAFLPAALRLRVSAAFWAGVSSSSAMVRTWYRMGRWARGLAY